MCDVITYLCFNFNCDLSKTLLKLEHGWVIIRHCFIKLQLLIHDPESPVVCIISVNKRGPWNLARAIISATFLPRISGQKTDVASTHILWPCGNWRDDENITIILRVRNKTNQLYMKNSVLSRLYHTHTTQITINTHKLTTELEADIQKRLFDLR